MDLTENLIELRQQKGMLAKQAEDLLTLAATEKRDLTKEEDTKFEAIHADIEKLTKQIQRIEKTQSVTAGGDGRRSEPNPVDTRQQQDTRSFGKITDRDRSEALRAWMCAGSPVADSLTDTQIALAKRCGINPQSKQLTIRLGPALKPTMPYGMGLRASEDDFRMWREKQEEERAALTGLQSTTTTGGYTTADETMKSLEVALLNYAGMRQVATVIRTATGGPLPIPTTNDTGNKGEIIGENTTSNELEMTFGQLVLDAWKYSSKYILASIEFLQDTSINANAFLGEALGNRIARITNDHFTTGTGSQPNGVVTAATSSSVTLSGVASASYDNIVDLVHSVDPAYRPNGRFMFHDGGLKMLKKIKVLQYSGDTTGQPLWVPGLALGQADTILGYPYVINQSMTTPATGVKSILFGDFSKYIIRDVRDVTVIRLDELYAVLGQVAFLALSRHDGDLLDAGTHPIKYATQA
jgi:HK97 family phage major capsid protein